MALPAHLQAFDRLLDLIAERMVADELAGLPVGDGQEKAVAPEQQNHGLETTSEA
ncbi:MAG: hypothetical protein IT483_15670 [Gammaproteobacteria bacterium]|nr:hypothetical protein [Gammaproteobacteria bacterium]